MDHGGMKDGAIDLEGAVQRLVRIGRAQGDSLTVDQIDHALPVPELDPDTLGRVMERLDAEGIEVELDNSLLVRRAVPAEEDAVPHPRLRPAAPGPEPAPDPAPMPRPPPRPDAPRMVRAWPPERPDKAGRSPLDWLAFTAIGAVVVLVMLLFV